MKTTIMIDILHNVIQSAIKAGMVKKTDSFKEKLNAAYLYSGMHNVPYRHALRTMIVDQLNHLSMEG